MNNASLGELIAERRAALGLSLRQLDELTDQLGHRISYSTLHSVESQQRNTLPDDSLAVLAKALRISAWKLRAAAGKPPAAPRPFHLPDRAAELNAKERAAVLAVVEALLSAKDRK